MSIARLPLREMAERQHLQPLRQQLRKFGRCRLLSRKRRKHDVLPGRNLSGSVPDLRDSFFRLRKQCTPSSARAMHHASSGATDRVIYRVPKRFMVPLHIAWNL